jgi:hypothetical protein
MFCKVSCITPDALIAWNMKSAISEPITQHAPILTEILRVAAQTERANRLNTLKDYSIVRSDIISIYMPPSRLQACQVMITQLAKLRSNCSLFFAAPFTLFLWTNGASRQVIEALARCGLCISFTSVLPVCVTAIIINMPSFIGDRPL